jgi:acyl-CoA thioesterase
VTLTGDDLARACAAAMLSRDRAAQALGIAIEEAREGYVRLVMPIRADMINGHDTVHGGVTFTLADTAFAFACNSRNVPHVALQASISFTAPGKLGDVLTAEGREVTLKGRTGVYDITVTNGAGALVGTFRGVCYRIHGTVLED